MLSPILARETDKYDSIWQIEDYHNSTSPGAEMVDMFIDIAQPPPHSLILDIGAGAGAGSRVLKDKGFTVHGFDLMDTGWRQEDIPLHIGTVWKAPLNVPGMFNYGYCCDVMEHIPTEFTALAVSNMLAKCGRVFFTISFYPDNFGQRIGQPLHLTVKEFTWWRDMLREVGTLQEARDLIGEGVFYVR